MRRILLLLLASTSTAFAQDTTAPTASSLVINSGDGYSTSATVSLGLAATDDVAVTQMCVSNASACTSWISYATTYSWNLGTSPQGTRTVYAKFRDAAGNVSSQISDTIVLDTVAPTGGTLTATNAGAGTLSLSWSGFTEATSGIGSYIVAYRTGSTPGLKCATGTTTSTTSTAADLTGLTDGTTYYLRVCAVDAAGNIANGATTTAVPVSESDPPVGTVDINSGAEYASSTTVTLTLSATDASGVSQMCVSNTTSCTSWQTYSTTRSWSFSGSGTKTVYVYFKDVNGNVSAAASDSITLDTTAPTNGTVSATSGDGSVDLSWSGFADTTSGISSYKVVQNVGTPASCSSGTVVYTGSATSVSLTSLSNGTTYGFRVCAINGAGLTSTGATVTATPASELEPPINGVVQINSGAEWANSTSVTLSLSAEDESGIAYACVSNTTSCTTWAAYAATRSWTLGGSGTTRTVYAWFKDSNGNATTSPVSDSISLDVIKPIDGSVTGVAATTTVSLSWSGFSDASSGISSYKVVYTRGSAAPGSCDLGNVGYTGTATSATINGLSDGSTYGFRVCAIDAAGNVSAGAAALLTTVSDTTPPTGTFTINGGATWANSYTLTLNLSATDDLTGVGRYCVSAISTSCTTWGTYASTVSYTLPAAYRSETSSRTLYVWFEDGSGNVTTSPVSDSIGLDVTDPVDGTGDAFFVDASLAAMYWENFADSLSGMESYIVSYNLDGSEPVTCDSGQIQMTTTDVVTELTGISDALAYIIRVCGVDTAGNVSDGMTVLLTGCAVTTYYADADSDGFGDPLNTLRTCEPYVPGYVTNDDDCDDTNSDIFPTAFELCDDLDNDCDLSIDEDAVNPSTFYYDADSDGYGDSTITASGCDAPANYVATGDDCNEAASAINPGASETCNDTDDNCNTLIDEGATDAVTWYDDVDGDLYGDPLSGAVSCDAPAGAVSNGLDCDDDRSFINPDADEVCGNGVDDNCDNMGCELSGSVSAVNAIAKIIGENADEQAGRNLAPVGDINGDGVDDLLIGADQVDNGTLQSAGALYVLYGPVDGPVDLSTADAKVIGTADYDYVGAALASAGDVNGDGETDFFTGASGADTAATYGGAAYILHGPLSGSAAIATVADAVWTGGTNFDRAGWSVAAGDFTGDGVSDMAVGAYQQDSGGNNAGTVYIVNGTSTGTNALSGAAARLIGEDALDNAGYVLASPGDLDDDGFEDILVAAPSDDDGGTDAGAAYVVLGPISGALDLSLADVKVIGENNSDFAGWSLAGPGDVDGDGTLDILIGAYKADNGLVSDVGATYLVTGSILFSSSVLDLSGADAKIMGATAGEQAGTSSSGAGDVDDNSYADILIGAPLEDTAAANAGSAYLFLGPVMGTTTVSSATVAIRGERSGDRLGFSLSALGDVNEDGMLDFATGAHMENTGGTDAGAVYVFSYISY